MPSLLPRMYLCHDGEPIKVQNQLKHFLSQCFKFLGGCSDYHSLVHSYESVSTLPLKSALIYILFVSRSSEQLLFRSINFMLSKFLEHLIVQRHKSGKLLQIFDTYQLCCMFSFSLLLKFINYDSWYYFPSNFFLFFFFLLDCCSTNAQHNVKAVF